MKVQIHEKMIHHDKSVTELNLLLRTESGHWKIDTVIGKKDEGKPYVLALVEPTPFYFDLLRS